MRAGGVRTQEPCLLALCSSAPHACERCVRRGCSVMTGRPRARTQRLPFTVNHPMALRTKFTALAWFQSSEVSGYKLSQGCSSCWPEGGYIARGLPPPPLFRVCQNQIKMNILSGLVGKRSRTGRCDCGSAVWERWPGWRREEGSRHL